MTDIQWIDQTERQFLASLTPPLAVVGQRGRFSLAAEQAIAKARAEGFGFLGDKGHPNTVTKAPVEKKVSLSKPAPAAPATAPTEPTKTVTLPTQSAPAVPATDAGVMRAWARSQGITVGERGRIHPDVKAAYAAAHGGTLPVKAAPAPKVEKPKAAAPVVKAEPKPVKVRTQTVAYGRVRRGDYPKYVSEPILAIENCFGCKKRIAYCTHEAPIMPKWAGGETAVFSKADAK